MDKQVGMVASRESGRKGAMVRRSQFGEEWWL